MKYWQQGWRWDLRTNGPSRWNHCISSSPLIASFCIFVKLCLCSCWKDSLVPLNSSAQRKLWVWSPSPQMSAKETRLIFSLEWSSFHSRNAKQQGGMYVFSWVKGTGLIFYWSGHQAFAHFALHLDSSTFYRKWVLQTVVFWGWGFLHIWMTTKKTSTFFSTFSYIWSSFFGNSHSSESPSKHQPLIMFAHWPKQGFPQSLCLNPFGLSFSFWAFVIQGICIIFFSYKVFVPL